MKRIITIAALISIAGVVQSNAAQIVRELWDNVAGTAGGYLQGATNGNTSFGFFAGQKWTVNPADPAATNSLLVNASNDAFDDYIKVFPMLLASATAPGTLNLAQPNTNGWDSGTWGTRLLATASQIHLNANGVYYFSARLVKRSFYFPTGGTNGYGADDAALGFGFSQGSGASGFFVGAGITRSVAGNPSGGGGYIAADGSTDIGDSVYVTSGTLGQAGLPGHPSDSGGPYYVRAFGFPQEVEGYIGGANYVAGGWLVGRLTTTASGVSELDARVYVAGDTIDTDPSLVSWDVAYNFTNTVTLNNLLVWMYGNNNFNPTYVDGIRAATTWAEAVGEEIIGPPIASPTNSVYPGTPVTFTAVADVADANSWYQWMTNGVPDPNGSGLGSNTYTLPNPVLANSGMTVSVAFSNGFSSGLVLTSMVQTLTVLPPVSPIIVQAPANGKRYVGASSFSFNVAADGARPFAYQWSQIVGGVTNTLSGKTNASLTFSNIQPGSAGTFFVTVVNGFGPTVTPPVTLSVVTPTGYAAAVIANKPYAYWQMDETTNSPVVTNGTVNGIVTNGTFVVAHDNWGGNDGVYQDLTNLVLGVPGAVGFGFPANHTGVFIPNNSFLARVDMPALPLYTNVMTLACWIYTPTVPNAAGLVFNRDYNQGGGYGNAYGLEFVPSSTVTSTNFNTLGYQWGGFDLNPIAANLGYTWTNSGLYVPQASWTFVTLVLSNTQATIYMGTNNAPLTVASAALPASLDTAFPGTVYTNGFPLLIGRGGYPYGEVQGNAYNNVNVQMSDVAVFYSALAPTNVYKLYLAAIGELITTTNSNGNLVLSWPAGALASSTNVAGPYIDVVGATSPYIAVKDKSQKFYRVQQ
jgi:hypothetical protein